jgi:CRP-like cAMP-binding protein
MFAVFEAYIRQKNKIPDEELEILREGSTIRKLRKGQSILSEGQIWSINCFIVSGCFRLFRYDNEGVDHTARFGVENWWISDLESYNNNKPTEYNIEALAASTVLVWTRETWTEILRTCPAVAKFNEQLLARGYEASQRRIFSLISSTATEKYFEFQKTYPKVFEKVPLHMVASYLGISRETLSRIRKEHMNH